MMNNTILEVTIHSALAVKALIIPAFKLWYYLRALDMNGSGKVSLPLISILCNLGISKATLYRYLSNNLLFRNYHNDDGSLSIYLTSLPKVCKKLNITSLGTIGYGDARECIVAQAIAIQAQGLQQQSFYLANRANKISSTETNKPEFYRNELRLKPSYNPCIARHPIVNPITCFFDSEGNVISPSDISPGVNGEYITIAKAHNLGGPAGVRNASLVRGRSVYNYLQANSYVLPFGGSQRGIADRLGISISTVKRYLEKHPKVRIAYKTTWFHYYKHKFEASENFGKPLEEGFIISSKYRSSNGKGDVFKWGTNLYYPLYSLTSSRRLRDRVSASCK